jgi:hypothetical protein
MICQFARHWRHTEEWRCILTWVLCGVEWSFLHAPHCFNLEKLTPYPLNDPETGLDTEEEQNLFTVLGMKPKFVGCLGHSHVSTKYLISYTCGVVTH